MVQAKRTRQIIVGDTPIIVDFKLLQKQKRSFLEIASPPEAAAGLLEFLDAFQDAAALVLGEKVVFEREIV